MEWAGSWGICPGNTRKYNRNKRSAAGHFPTIFPCGKPFLPNLMDSVFPAAHGILLHKSVKALRFKLLTRCPSDGMIPTKSIL